MIFAAISLDSTIAANINPFPLISLIFGCFRSCLINFSFSSVSSIKVEFCMVFTVATAAEAITGCPPKVVICPNLG